MTSTRDLESQAETNRSQIAATLEELRSRMSTGQLIDHAMTYARGHGGAEFMRNLGDQVKANPLPLALVAAGLGWLILGRPRATRHTDAPSIVPDDPVGPGEKSLNERFDELARDTSAEVAGAVRDSTSSATKQVRDAVAAARDSAQHATSAGVDTMASARDSLSSAYGGMTDAVARTASAVSDTAAAIGDVRYSTAERVRQAGGDISEQAGRAQNAITQLIHEQPLIVGAVGLTIGAIIGASLPRSRKGDQVVGEASGSSKTGAAGIAREQVAHLEQAGRRIVEKVRNVAEDQSLTSDSGKALVRDIGAKVSAVAAAGKEGVEDELKSTKEQTAAAESERQKFQADEPARVERYSEADPSYLPAGSGQL